MDELTATVAETRANFSKIATTVNATGRPVTVFKNSKPWVVIAPVGAGYGDHIPAIDWSALDVVAMDRETRTTVSTMPSRRPVVGELWLAYVEFIDRPGVGKVRPAAVVDVDEATRSVIALKVTSRDLRDDPAIPCLPIEDWERRGLVKPSFIRLDQRFELAWERLLRDAPLGTLGANDMKAIEDFLGDGNAS